MLEIYNLPTLLRLFLFVLLSIILVILMILIVFKIISKSRDIKHISYLISLFISILFLTMTRIPLYDQFSLLTFHLFNSILILPIITDILMIIKKKTFIYILDLVFLILNLPFFSFLFFWEVINIVSVWYCFIRLIVASFDMFFVSKNESGIYLIKEALDTLKYGIVFANQRGQIIFINKSMKEYFRLLKIKEHLKVNQIFYLLLHIEKPTRHLASNSIIINVDQLSLNFQFKKNTNHKKYSQIICMDVTEEEKMIKELEETKNKLNLIQKDLQKTVMEIEDIEKEKEILRIKGNLHDTLSQRLSILHCYIIENKGEDIKQIKALISSMLSDMYNNGQVMPSERLHHLISSFSTINVQLKIDGQLPLDAVKSDFVLKVIRECTTNAVRHGKASIVHVVIKNNKENYTIVIANNGVGTPSIIEGNGLKSIRYQLLQLNGKMTIKSYPKFKIEFEF